jgi:hypothetical protein
VISQLVDIINQFKWLVKLFIVNIEQAQFVQHCILISALRNSTPFSEPFIAGLILAKVPRGGCETKGSFPGGKSFGICHME